MPRIEVLIDGVDAPLWVRHFRIREALSAPFEVFLEVRSTAADIDLDRTSWAAASFSLAAGWAYVLGGGARTWTGIVQSIRQTAVELSGLSTYRINLVPRLYLLTQNQDYRIFQRQTVPQIVKRLLDDWFVEHEWRLNPAGFPALEYRVQYGESDFAFLSRLCEEAGISFCFEYRDGGSILVLSDEPSAAPVRPGPPLPFEASPNEVAEAEFVSSIELCREGSPLRVVLRDVDFRRPDFPLYGEAEPGGVPSARLERRHYAPGAFRVHTMAPPPSSGAPSAPKKGAGRHDPRAGEQLAARLVLAETALARTASFETNALDLAPGVVVAISGHPHPLLDPERNRLLVTEYSLEGDHDKEWLAKCRAVWTEPAYKPALRTPKPKVHGLQSAIVQGPRDREVFTDEHGRIKVRFFWDREARDDEQTSCWIRVSQVWTGAGFGIWAIPRVGQEVLVGFLEGNPDEPIVMGHVPNALTPPPYALPTNQTKTVLRTRSTGGGDGHNEISFEDLRGSELLFTRAEKDRESLVRGNDRELVGGNVHKLVSGDEHVSIKGDRYDEVHGDEHKGIEGDAKAKVGGDLSLGVGGDLSVDIGGTLSVRVGGRAYLVALDKLLLAASDASMQSGGGFVRATAGAVFVSPLVQNAGMSGSGTPNAPAMPSPPTMPAAYQPHLPAGPRRLPVLGWIGGVPPIGSMTDEQVICWAICECKDSINWKGNTNRQQCFINKIRAWEHVARGTTHIWSEVPYDMSKSPPEPIMSRTEPWRATGRKPDGSRIPDIILVKDPSLPPTVDNIDRIIEVKFPGDPWRKGQREAYDAIGDAAGGVRPEQWGVDFPCYCSDQEQEQPEPVKVPQEDAVKAAIIAAAIIVLLLDDAVGGYADDVAIPGLLGELGKLLPGLGVSLPELAPILP